MGGRLGLDGGAAFRPSRPNFALSIGAQRVVAAGLRSLIHNPSHQMPVHIT